MEILDKEVELLINIAMKQHDTNGFNKTFIVVATNLSFKQNIDFMDFPYRQLLLDTWEKTLYTVIIGFEVLRIQKYDLCLLPVSKLSGYICITVIIKIFSAVD